MKLSSTLALVLGSVAARVTTRGGGAYKEGVNVDAPVLVDDYGDVIERDYDSQFYRPNQESEEWIPTESELEETTTETYDYPEATPEPEVVEPYINSKFDVNRPWLTNEEVEWQPSEQDQLILDEDVTLDLSYE